MLRAPISKAAAVLGGLGLSLGVPLPVSAQAWLPAKGEGSVSMTYQTLGVRDHLLSDGEKGDFGHIRANSVLLDLGYGLTDRLAVGLSLPYVTARYRGSEPEATIDDGRYHGAVQDFRLHVRYLAVNSWLVVTPFVEAGMPSHAYDTLGHTAVGRDLREVLVGVHLGRQLDPILPDAYVQARYSHAFVETVAGHEDHKTNRSNVDLEVGYLVTPSLTLMALTSWQKTHGGIEWSFITSEEEEHAHDRFAQANYLRLFGGASYAFNRSVSIYAGVGAILHGENTHAGTAIAFGTHWSFGRRAAPPQTP